MAGRPPLRAGVWHSIAMATCPGGRLRDVHIRRLFFSRRAAPWHILISSRTGRHDSDGEGRSERWSMGLTDERIPQARVNHRREFASPPEVLHPVFAPYLQGRPPRGPPKRGPRVGAPSLVSQAEIGEALAAAAFRDRAWAGATLLTSRLGVDAADRAAHILPRRIRRDGRREDPVGTTMLAD